MTLSKGTGVGLMDTVLKTGPPVLMKYSSWARGGWLCCKVSLKSINLPAE
jgi:hypothetical protein